MLNISILLRHLVVTQQIKVVNSKNSQCNRDIGFVDKQFNKESTVKNNLNHVFVLKQ